MWLLYCIKTKINFRQTEDLKVKIKTIKLFKDNMRN
jgi:hypothetical protein